MAKERDPPAGTSFAQASGVRRRSLQIVLVVALAAAPSVARAGIYRSKPKVDRRAAATRLVKKTWGGVKKLPRRARQVARDAYAVGIGPVAAVATAFGAVAVAGGNTKAVPFLVASVVMAGVNYGNTVLQRRAARSAQRRKAKEEAFWRERGKERYFDFGSARRAGAQGGAGNRAPPRRAPADRVAEAYAYFGLPAGLGIAEAKDQAKAKYRKLARKYHPDVAAQNGLSVEQAEAKFKELARHHESIEKM